MSKGEALFGKEGVKDFMDKMNIPEEIKSKIMSKDINYKDFSQYLDEKDEQAGF